MTNEDIIESIICLLAVDSRLNKHEMHFLDDVCKRLDITKETRNALLNKARGGKGKVHLPEDEADKKRLVYFLMQAVAADGTLDPKEREVLYVVVDKMGLPRADVDRFLSSRLKEVNKEKYTASVSRKPPIKCPKCGFEQPAGFRCRRCGIIFEKYEESKEPTDEDRLWDILSSSNVIKKGE